MNRREFIQYSVAASALAGTPALAEQGGTPVGTQPTKDDAAAARRKMVAYCGLYCGLSDSHARLPQRAAALAESIALAEFPPPKQVAQFLKDLSHPSNDKRCRGGTCGPKCAIKKCAMAKGVTVCAECSEFPCRHIETLARSESTLVHDGLRIRKIGLDAWIEEQEQRKARGFCYADVRCLPCTVPQE